MDFKEHTKESERFLSGRFHYDNNDEGENALREVVETYLASAEKLDQYKKNKYYGRVLPANISKEDVQMTVQQFERSGDNMEKTLHAAIGLSTECSELLEAVYKNKWGGMKLDVVNLKEEIGDLFWYLAILFRDYDLDLGDILQTNIDKLDKRYGKKFTEEAAINRDLKAEREILEGKNPK